MTLYTYERSHVTKVYFCNVRYWVNFLKNYLRISEISLLRDLKKCKTTVKCCKKTFPGYLHYD